MTSAPAWTPTSTYRLQLGPGVTFGHVEALTPYLASLGVGALYLSPLLKPRPGSLHGYDICDHATLNPDLGTEADLARLAATARAHGLRLVVDIVPNHMAADPDVNLWWREVLENGPCSPFAEYFDIDWDPVTPHLRQKVLLPILGDQYGDELERGQLRLEYDDGRLQLLHVAQRLPINPRQVPLVLRHAVEPLREAVGEAHPALIEFQSILEGLHNLPPYTDTQPERIVIRAREKEVLRGRLLRLVDETPFVLDAINAAVAHVNGTPGNPASFDQLHGLLEAQPYRLASWRTAVDEINYRRFFDVNDLAGICVEHEQVFAATHALVAGWLRDGLVHGLRVDHPDGLFDPSAYFDRLHVLARDATGLDNHVYVVAEKILSGREHLRGDWQVHGTTGYEFLGEVNGLFLDPAGMRQLQQLYARVTGQRAPLDEVAYAAKKLIITTTMSSELGVLADALARIARADRHTRDFTLNSLRKLIIEYVACTPVYRTYVSHRGWTDEDERMIDRTIAEARRRNPAMEGSLFRFLRDVLLPGPADDVSQAASSMRARRLAFAMRLQQYTGPVQAKGVEDTTFYRYNVLVSLTEVGGEPSRAVRSVQDVHASNLARLLQWPAEMTTLSTHDTKLGEDVRARINVLSEIVDEWRGTLRRVLRATAASHVRLAETRAPDRNDEYRFLQVLVGCWPPGVPLTAPAPVDLVRRLQAYMIKAIREAKRHTSWITPNEPYESGMLAYVDAVLRGPSATRVLAALSPLVARVSRQGVTSSLAQTVLKLTSPGVPDLYQGAEGWVFDLVDPDNRRPVDFDRLARALDDIDSIRSSPAFGPSQVADWLETWPTGDVKRHVVSTLLRLRRRWPDFWLQSAYRPLPVEISVPATAIAFARVGPADAWAITLAGLRTARMTDPWPVGRAWATSRLLLPDDAPAGTWHDLLSGAEITPAESSSQRWVFLGEALQTLPTAVLVPARR